MAGRNHYQALGVAPAASTDDIQKAYRTLAREHHPDRILEPAKKAKAEELFTAITEAFNTLSNPARRAEYDKELRDGGGDKSPQAEAKSCARAGLSRLNDGHIQEALRMFRAAVHLDPENAAYYAHLATALQKTKAYGEAMRVWEEAIKHEKYSAKYYRFAGECAEQAGMRTKARRFYETALKWDKNDSAAAAALQRLSGNEKKAGILSGLFKRE